MARSNLSNNCYYLLFILSFIVYYSIIVSLSCLLLLLGIAEHVLVKLKLWTIGWQKICLTEIEAKVVTASVN